MTETNAAENQSGKTAILDAAELLFSEQGFAGTTISQIAEKSGQSGSLVIFHFKNKESLYEAVKAAIVDRYSTCPPEPIEEAEGLEEILRNFMRAKFAYYRNNPTMVRLANWTSLEGDLDEWEGASEWHRRYIDKIEAAQKTGEIRDDITPYRAMVIIVGAIHVWWEYHDQMLRALDATGSPDAADESYFAELEAILQRGLAPAEKP